MITDKKCTGAHYRVFLYKMMINPESTTKEIVRSLDLSYKTVYCALSYLKENNLLE
jgi:hypothetical protein